MKTFGLLFFLILAFFVTDGLACGSPGKPKSISAPTKPLPKDTIRGLGCGRAISLVKPAYPPAAKKVKAFGPVNVEVIIGKDGLVKSAKAVSGHPLLQSAAEQAALASKFSPTKIAGKFFKVQGIIVYNFVKD